jgi:hypothetical protein
VPGRRCDSVSMPPVAHPHGAKRIPFDLVVDYVPGGVGRGKEVRFGAAPSSIHVCTAPLLIDYITVSYPA